MFNYIGLAGFALLMVQGLAAQSSFVKDNFPVSEEKIFYQEVISVDSTVSADKLYLETKKWLTKVFESSEKVIELDDHQSSTIVIKGFVEKGHNGFVKNPKNWFTLTVECKQGRFRYTLTDILYEFSVTLEGYSNEYHEPFEKWMVQPEVNSKRKREKTEAYLNQYCKELNNELEQIIKSLISTLSDSNENEDW